MSRGEKNKAIVALRNEKGSYSNEGRMPPDTLIVALQNKKE